MSTHSLSLSEKSSTGHADASPGVGGGSRVMSCSAGGNTMGGGGGMNLKPSCFSSCSMYLSVLKMSTDLRSDGSFLQGGVRSLNMEMFRIDWRCTGYEAEDAMGVIVVAVVVSSASTTPSISSYLRLIPTSCMFTMEITHQTYL